MSAIRDWAYALCSFSILYTILESFLPEKEPFPVIKLSAALYILIALLTPYSQLSFSVPEFSPSVSSEAFESVSYERAVLEKAEQTISEFLKNELHRKGYSVQDVKVTLFKEENKIVVSDIAIQSEKKYQDIKEIAFSILEQEE